MIGLALYQPDIPQNCGAAIRLAACLGVSLDLIGPFGFVWDEARVKRVAMDYLEIAKPARHSGWAAFTQARAESRLVLLTTKASVPYTDFQFQAGDVLIMGRESAGVPDDIHASIPHRIRIPMHGEARSLNVINAAAMALGEALRQTKGF